MAYVIKEVVVKPAGVLWFVQSGGTSATTLANMAAWTVSQPGYLDSNLHITNSNESVIFIVFDTQANAQAWQAGQITQPDYMVHSAYYASQGITTTVTTYP